jgi:hypothetical protein
MANQRKAVQPERLLYPVYSVKMAGYADTAAGAFELQEELLAEDDSGTFVIGRAIDASEIELPDDVHEMDDHGFVTVLPVGTEEEDAEDIAAGDVLADELDAEDVDVYDITTVELPEQDVFIQGTDVLDAAGEKIGETKPLTDVWTEAEIAAKRDAAVRDAVDAAFDNTAKE